MKLAPPPRVAAEPAVALPAGHPMKPAPPPRVAAEPAVALPAGHPTVVARLLPRVGRFAAAGPGGHRRAAAGPAGARPAPRVLRAGALKVGSAARAATRRR